MGQLIYLSKKSSRLYNSYHKAYSDAKWYRMHILDEDEKKAKEKAHNDVKICFNWLNE